MAERPVRRADPPYPRFEARTRAEWRAWLRRHHAKQNGVWLVTFKAGSGEPQLSAAAAAEEALAYGWIDSLPRKLDERRSMLLVTPRKRGSSWSKINKERVERLLNAGKMAAAGLAKVDAAQRDGSWDRLNDVDELKLPSDLAALLDAHPRAREHFQNFPRSTKRGILEWILNAKRPETRARRIEDTVLKAGRNVRANQYERKT